MTSPAALPADDFVPATGELRLGEDTFEYLAAGPKDGPLVLCAHGFPDIPRGFVGIMPTLVAAGYRVVAPWMRGYAPSTLRGPFDMTTIGDDLCRMADALSPGRPVHLLGHDWGAGCAYAAMRQAPERFAHSVTMSVPHGSAFTRNIRSDSAQQKRSRYIAFFLLPWLPERRIVKHDFAYIDELWARWSPGLTPDPAYMRELKQCLERSLPAPLGYYRALRPSAAANRRQRDMDENPLEVPTLYLCGADDGCISYAAGAGQEKYFARGFESEAVEDAGHFIQLERPGWLARRLVQWFSQTRATE